MDIFKCFHTFIAPPTNQCPADYPYLERHGELNYGDVCRKSDTNSHKCPDGCLYSDSAPWCKRGSSDEPCRAPKGIVEPHYIPQSFVNTITN